MRFTIALFALATSASAILLPRQTTLPECATTCLATADYGNCAVSDDSCLCNNTAFVTSSTQCIETTCSGSDLTAAETAAQELCAAVGVTLTSSIPLPTSSGATGASSAAASGASGASKPASATSASGTAATSKPTNTSGAGAVTANVFLVALAGFVGVAF